MSTINIHKAMIFAMVTMAGVDAHLNEADLRRIREQVSHLPVFKGFDPAHLAATAMECGAILQQEDGGLDAVLGLIEGALPVRLRETAYALAVEIAAADLAVSREEIRFLAMLRDRLKLDKLVTAAIERNVIARYQHA